MGVDVECVSIYTPKPPRVLADENVWCRRAMKRDCKTVAAWDFERMIPCHGVCPPFPPNSTHFLFSDRTAPILSGRARKGRKQGLPELFR